MCRLNIHVAQYKRQLGEVKAELSLISRDVAFLEPEGETWSQLENKACKFHFDLSLKHCCSHHGEDKGSKSLNDKIGVKLPRLKVSSFNVNWQSFWGQYYISVHGRTQLSDLKKLAYLKFAQKGGSAKHIVEGIQLKR